MTTERERQACGRDVPDHGLSVWLMRRTRVLLVAGDLEEPVDLAEPLPLLARLVRGGLQGEPARPIRRFLVTCNIVAHLLTMVVASGVIVRGYGPTLLWGKVRRVLLSAIPPLARYLQRHYRLSGSCKNCGASCTIMFDCPFWESESRLCSVYQDRPTLCRLFPITPSDLRDRDLASGHDSCGFSFSSRTAPEFSHAGQDDLMLRLD